MSCFRLLSILEYWLNIRNFDTHFSATYYLRYFIKFSYFGKYYHGWQVQPNALSVQQILMVSLRMILREDIELTGAGRTDTGVHAKEMFAHFDTSKVLEVDAIRYKINAILPDDIAVSELFEVNQKAHARFDAFSRSYEYHIHTEKDAFLTDFSFYLKRIPEISKMNTAAEFLLKHTDFQCFSKTKTEVNNFNCTITEALWRQEGSKLVFEITANRFLRNMVRAITGTLLDVGFGKINMMEFQQILDSKNRSKAGTSVPAHGLYLTKVLYNAAEIQPQKVNLNES